MNKLQLKLNKVSADELNDILYYDIIDHNFNNLEVYRVFEKNDDEFNSKTFFNFRFKNKESFIEFIQTDVFNKLFTFQVEKVSDNLIIVYVQNDLIEVV